MRYLQSWLLAIIVFSSVAFPAEAATVLSDGFSGTELDTTIWEVYVPGVSYSIGSGLLTVTDVSDSAASDPWHEGLITAPLPVGNKDFHLEVHFDYYESSLQWLRVELLIADGSQSAVIAIIRDNRSYILLQDMDGPYAESLDPALGVLEFAFDRNLDTMAFSWNGVTALESVNSDTITHVRLNFGRYGSGEFGTVSIDSVLATGVGTIRVPDDQPTIQGGINAAVDGDTVLVAAGVYVGAGNRDIDFFGKSILLLAPEGPESTVIDCQGTPADPHRGFWFRSGEDSTSVLDGFTVTNGFETAGGGILCQASPWIRNCIITQDSASSGGGLAVNGFPLLQDCIISNNAADREGGGIYGTFPRLRNCRIEGNRVWSLGGDPYLGRGGGLYAKIDAENCVFARNWAQRVGGAIDSRDAGVYRIVNCTFYGNTAGFQGSCIHFDAETHPELINTIITGHTGNSTLYCWGVANPKFQNCDVWGNPAGDALCGTNLGGNISQDPVFCASDIDDFRLDVNSPCAGAGVPDSVPRDIGAFGIGCNALIDSSELLVDPTTGHRYRRFDFPPGFSWHMARDSAIAWGGHLATITSINEDNLLEALVYPNISWTVAWCGATDELSEGNWMWVTGEPFIYSDWHPINFDNQNGVQDYLSVLGGVGAWDDTYSVYPNPYAGSYGNSFVVEWECNCSCHADPHCDQQTDIIDVTLVVEFAFRDRAISESDICDAIGVGNVANTDVDCSGFTDVLDVIRLVNVAFRNASPATEFCSPCP